MVTFAPVGWDNGRVPVPAGAVDCPNMAALVAQINLYTPGGANNGQSVDLHLSGTSYAEIGILDYVCTDGGTGLRLYGNQDGSTVVTYGAAGGMADAASCAFRIGSSQNNQNDSRRIEVYNLDIDGASTGDGVGANWGVIIGGAFNNDDRRGNVFEIVVQGVRSRRSQQIGLRFDGNGGTDGVTARYCTIQEAGQQYVNGVTAGFGEGIYLGDGSTGRAYNNALVEYCEVFDCIDGEAIEAKRNGTAIIRFNEFHDIEISDGGNIKIEGHLTTDPTDYIIEGNRVWDCRSTPNANDNNGGTAIETTGACTITNNICWDFEKGGITFVRSAVTGASVIVRNNTIDATGGAGCYTWGEGYAGPEEYPVDADANVLVGNVNSGTPYGGFSQSNDYNIPTGDFVGPVSTGTADAGDGPGSGYELTAASAARNGVAATVVAEDIQMLTRVNPTDAGAIDADLNNVNLTPVAQDNTFNATVGTAASFDYTFNDTLGDAPNTYAFVSGALPPGMGINTGPAPDVTNRVTGTPTTAGTYTFTYSLTDDDGEVSQADITVIVAAADINPVAVNDNFTFTVGVASTADLSLNDDPGNTPSTWSFTDAFPSVPPGMTLNPATGVISGTPTTVGVYQDQYTITDDDGDVATQATYTITIQAANVGSPTATNDDLGTIPCDVALNFSVATNDALGDGTAGQHTWAFVSGAIPPGLTLSPAGLLAGTPTTPGSYQFTYSLEDVDGDQDTATVTVVVAEKTTGDGPGLVDDFDTTAQVDVAYSFDVTANDDLGVTPTIVSYDSGNVPPGLTFAAGILSGTPTLAGTYQFVYEATDANGQTDTATATIVVAAADGPAPGECCEIALTFLTVEADGPATSCCDPRPLIVDANGGSAYANGFDAAGNPAVVVPGLGVAKDAVTYISTANGAPAAECCLTNEDIGRPAYDSAQNCVTHICMGPSLGWRAICGNGDGGTVEPPDDAEVERVCYSTTGVLPGAYGGTGTGWLVSGLQQLDIACEGTVTGSPTFIGFNDDFCDDGANVLTNGSFYPNAAVYPLTYTDTGQMTAADANSITDPTCFNSIFAVDFATSMSTGDSAPIYSFDVIDVVGGSPINFAFYNNVTGIIEPIASAAGGGSIQNNPASPGDYYNVTTAGTSHTVTLLNDVSPADVTMMILSMSSSNVFDDDRVENIEVSYVAETDCCNAVNTAADLAALFTANDPIGNTWTIIGSTVCSDMPIGQGASYGVLQLCDVGPVTPTIGFP